MKTFLPTFYKQKRVVVAVGIDSKDFRGSSQVTIDFLDKSPPPHVHVLLGDYFFFFILLEKHDSFSEMEILDKTSLLF